MRHAIIAAGMLLHIEPPVSVPDQIEGPDVCIDGSMVVPLNEASQTVAGQIASAVGTFPERNVKDVPDTRMCVATGVKLHKVEGVEEVDLCFPDERGKLEVCMPFMPEQFLSFQKDGMVFDLDWRDLDSGAHELAQAYADSSGLVAFPHSVLVKNGNSLEKVFFGHRGIVLNCHESKRQLHCQWETPTQTQRAIIPIEESIGESIINFTWNQGAWDSEGASSSRSTQ